MVQERLSQWRHPMEGLIIIATILGVWYWLGHASLTQMIRNESDDPSATVTTKEVIIYMVLSLIAVRAAEEIIRKLQK